MADTVVNVAEKVKVLVDIPPPKQYSVILFNDEITSAVFVAQCLMEVFGYGAEDAIELTNHIDEVGSGVAVSGVSHELAAHLRSAVLIRARSANFPLKAETKAE